MIVSEKELMERELKENKPSLKELIFLIKFTVYIFFMSFIYLLLHTLIRGFL